MEKIQLTQEQSEVVELRRNRKDKSSAIKHHIRNGWAGQKYRFLNDFTVDEFCRLLYVPGSYEVIPQYNENDWVYRNGEIDSIRWANYEKNLAYLDSIGMIGIDSIERHATPEEIQKEKKRRFWERLGREVDEYRTGDIVFNEATKQTYQVANGQLVPAKIVSCKLICPVEQRLDK